MGFLDEDEEEESSTEEEEEQEVIKVESEVQETEPVTDKGVTTAENDLLVPATEDLAAIKETYDQFEQIKSNLLTKDDKESASGKVFITKSGWRKIATAFNVSVESIKETKTVEDGIMTWSVTAKAVAPNGKSATGVGMCATNESRFMDDVSSKDEWDKEDEDVLNVDGKWRKLKDPRAVKEHDVYATAATRAKNRAISDLVGGGEVSAEEVSADDMF